MVKAGLATVYMDTGAEYGNIKEKLLSAEALAKQVTKKDLNSDSNDNDNDSTYFLSVA